MMISNGPHVITLGQGAVIVAPCVRHGIPVVVFATPSPDAKPGVTPTLADIHDGESFLPNCVVIELPSLGAACTYIDVAKQAVEMLAEDMRKAGAEIPTDETSIAEQLARSAVTLERELSEARAEVARLRGIIDKCRWYWIEDDSDYAANDPFELFSEADPGEVVCISRGGAIETLYYAWLPIAGQPDDHFVIEAATAAEAEAKVAAERVRRGEGEQMNLEAPR